MYWCHWAVVRVLVVVHIRRVASSMLRFHSQIVRSSLAAAGGGGGGGGEVPQPDRAVTGAGGQDVPVRAERHRVDSTARTGQGLGGAVRVCQAPQPDRVVVAAGGEGFAVRAERH